MTRLIESSIPKQVHNDTLRIYYLNGYIQNLIKAVTVDGVDVCGYFLVPDV